ncbi:hypothetical protein ABMY10_10130 [Vibrio vulnificus]
MISHAISMLRTMTIVLIPEKKQQLEQMGRCCIQQASCSYL